MFYSLSRQAGFCFGAGFVMERRGRLIGHVMYVRSKIHADDGRAIPIHDLRPHRHCAGMETTGLRHDTLAPLHERGKKLGAGALAITGNIGFYGKSGSVVAGTKDIHYFVERTPKCFIF